MTRLGTPKIGPGRVVLGIFGVFFGGSVFKPFVHRFFLFFYSADLEFVSLFMAF